MRRRLSVPPFLIGQNDRVSSCRARTFQYVLPLSGGQRVRLPDERHVLGLLNAPLADQPRCPSALFRPDAGGRRGGGEASAHDLLRECDIVSLHLPLTAETKQLIDERRLV